MWDAFISHAGEDKEDFAEPLAKELEDLGLNVWYDDFELSVGDDIPSEIKRGLSDSDYGIVVLSERFFDKNWPEEELNALIQRDIAESNKVILPVCFDISPTDVQSHDPLLSKRYLISGDSSSVSEVAEELYDEMLERSTQPLSSHDLEKFDPETIECLAEVIGRTKRGTEIEQFFERLDFHIEWDDAKAGSINEWVQTFPVEAKERGIDIESERERVIYEKLQELDNEDPSNIVAVIEKMAHPRNYIDSDENRGQLIAKLNKYLKFEDLRIVDSGEVKQLS
jgi:hypothetical protein